MARRSMTTSVTRAVAAMHWLTDADQAAVDLALTYARQIDGAAKESPDQARYLAVKLGPHLTGLLKQLGGTPEGRKALEVEESRVKGRLAELRAAHDRRSA